VWPFDKYPTFDDIVRRQTEILGVSAVRANGQEVDLGKVACMRAFGSAIRCLRFAKGLAAERDEARQRERTIIFTGFLWRNAPRDLQRDVKELRAYRIDYRIDTTEPRVVAKTLRYRFPVETVADAVRQGPPRGF
jgi:hypothetical protein